MDDDDVRRGRPTVHKVFGVREATVTGVAMVPLAALAAYDSARDLGLSTEASGAVVRELMRAAGAGGMIGGQVLDLDAEGSALSLEALERIHRGKTGALIAVSLRLGGMAAAAREDALDALTEFGAGVGHAFQIADDVLDVTATSDELGKTSGKDAAVHKSTYPALLGIDGARQRAEALVDASCERLRAAGLLTPALEQLARFAVDRRS
jgi:farnesyl diphosphate synthase/geranylgeranyl diphosphate synthase type II